MATTNQKIGYGILGLIGVVVAGFGGSLIISDEQLGNAYVCTTDGKVGLFDRLSSTSKTGYWSENSTERYSTCRNGIWMSLKDYAESKGVVLEPEETILQSKRFRCDTQKCEAII